MDTLNKLLKNLLQKAAIMGLSEADITAAVIFWEHNEMGLCFDTIVTQMYEYNIEIDTDFYLLAEDIASLMEVPPDSYSYIKELIR